MDFAKEVIRRSEEVPVLVDFWAPWCGPCKFIGPILEELAEASAGQWELVKVNTDENQDISSDYGIRGIPAIKLFYQGKVIGEFTGALPRVQVEKWLEEYLPDERKQKVAAFREAIERGERHETLPQLKAFVEAEPNLPEAKLLLASQIVFSDTDEALDLVTPASLNHKFLAEAQQIRDLAQLMTCPLDGQESINQIIADARLAARQYDLNKVLDLLIQAVMIDKSYCKDLPRKATVALFQLLGNQHELTRKYRKRFDMALY